VTWEEMKKRIAIILSQADPAAAIYRYRGGKNVGESNNFVAEPGEAEVVHEQLLLLRTLYAQCSPDLKAQFIPLLLQLLTPENAQLVCHGVLDAGNARDLQYALSSPVTSRTTAYTLWTALDEKLSMEPHKFSDSDLDLLEATLNTARNQKYKISTASDLFADEKITEQLDKVKRRIDRVRYLRLKKQLLEGENPEVNTDKQVLVSRLGTLGFRKEIIEALHELDTKLYAAGKPLDFKSCMDLLRTIYEEIVEDAAKTVGQKRNKPSPSGGPFQPWRQYLEDEGILSKDEGDLAQKLYNYLSNAGTHRLGSAPEQVRVSRNMVIELSLMVVGRVQNLR
jgi:hypothetical protein